MTDQYQTFAKSPIGKFVIKNLGLPSPTSLDRFESAMPVVKGAVLLGAAPASPLTGCYCSGSGKYSCQQLCR